MKCEGQIIEWNIQSILILNKGEQNYYALSSS